MPIPAYTAILGGVPVENMTQGINRRPERVLRGDHNQCAARLEYFNSTAAFEKHRTGDFGVDRRCRTAQEMEKSGMSRNADGWWITSAWTERRGAGSDALEPA